MNAIRGNVGVQKKAESHLVQASRKEGLSRGSTSGVWKGIDKIIISRFCGCPFTRSKRINDQTVKTDKSSSGCWI